MAPWSKNELFQYTIYAVKYILNIWLHLLNKIRRTRIEIFTRSIRSGIFLWLLLHCVNCNLRTPQRYHELQSFYHIEVENFKLLWDLKCKYKVYLIILQSNFSYRKNLQQNHHHSLEIGINPRLIVIEIFDR